jgi:hypothetical protein
MQEDDFVMRKSMFAVALAFALVFILTVGMANASPSLKFNWGSQTGPASNGPPAGAKLVVNINMQVSGDPDSGTAGNNWAVDEYNKHIQVWDLTGGKFYVDVKYVGSFTTVAGASPNANVTSGTVAEGIDGNMEGGYQATITGTLQTGIKTKGNLGQFVYPNLPDWLGQFFGAGATFEYIWWGWQYHTAQNGTWVNASTGNSGDIN